MAEVLNLDSEIKTIPGTGAGSLDCLIQLYIGWGKSFLVLLDGDAEGIKQRERYEQKFGALLNRRCILLPDICGESSIREAENLLSHVDTESLASAIYSPGTERPTGKKAFRQAVIELYAQRQAVEVERSTVRRFEHIFSELRRKLG
jgi:hypothetical protein